MKGNLLLYIAESGVMPLCRGRRVLILSTMAVLVTGIIAFASIPGTDGVIHGCYSKAGGALRVIDDSTTQCKSSETPLSFNQAGPAGPAGTSEAYVAVRAEFINVYYPQVIASRVLPAGNYIINANIDVRNETDTAHRVFCGFGNAGGSASGTIDPHSSENIPLLLVANFGYPTEIGVECGAGTDLSTYNVILTATRVETIHY